MKSRGVAGTMGNMSQRASAIALIVEKIKCILNPWPACSILMIMIMLKTNRYFKVCQRCYYYAQTQTQVKSMPIIGEDTINLKLKRSFTFDR